MKQHYFYSDTIVIHYSITVVIILTTVSFFWYCDILEDNVSNMSDHYGICVSLKLPLYDATDGKPDSDAIRYLAHSTDRPKWKDPIYEELYVAELP